MADNSKTFQDILKEQKKTNRENEANAGSLSDITSNALISVGDTITSGLNSTVNAISGGDDAQLDMFDSLNENIAAMGRVMEDGVKQDAEIAKADAAKEERQQALKESNEKSDPLPSDESFGKDLKESFSGVIGGLKGIFFGAAGIFAGIYLFIAALGNEKFRNVVFGAVDAVKQAFGDFNSLINGEMGLMEFLKENALTIAAITAILMPAKTFGLLLKAVKFLPAALATLQMAFATMKATFLTSILPVLTPLILPVIAISAVLFSLKKGFDDFKAKLDETDDIKTALLFGVSSFVGTLLALPATLFKTMIDGVLGLLEFITFGFLDFDDIQQKIRDLDFGGIMRDTIFNTLVNVGNYIKNTVLNAKQFLVDLGVKLGTFTSDLVDNFVGVIKGIGKKIYDPETGAIFGKVLPPFPTLGDIGTFLKEKAKLIYDSDTGAIFGYQLPELPSISDMFNVLTDFAKKIYDPETGAIFGFKLPSLSDLNPLKDFSLTRLLGGDDDDVEVAEKMKALDDSKSLKDSNLVDTDKPNNMQLEALLKKMIENGELSASDKAFIQQVNVVKGGDSVSSSSSTGFSTTKSAQNDDYAVQALAGSMP